MSTAISWSVIRVKEVFGPEAALVINLEDDASRGSRQSERVVHSASMARAGPDSFWRVSGEHSEPKPKVASKSERQPAAPILVAAPSVSFPNVAASKGLKFTSAAFGIDDSEQRPEIKSFKAEQRLHVGYSSGDLNGAEIIDFLMSGTLQLGLKQPVDAIDVGGGLWLRSSEFLERRGTYRLAANVKKFAVPVAVLSEPVQLLRAAENIVVFEESPTFEDAGHRDFRNEAEVLHSVDDWLARISESLKSTEEDRARIAELRGLLRKYVDETLGDDELNDLFATLTILEGRPTLLDALPDLLQRNPAWTTQVQAVADLEVSRILREFQDQHLSEVAEKRRTLDELNTEIQERRSELSNIAERQRAYRDAVADLEESIDSKLEAVVAKRSTKDRTKPSVSMDDLGTMRSELDRLGRIVSTLSPPKQPAVDTTSAQPIIERKGRVAQVALLVKLLPFETAATTAAIALSGGEVLPVFVGSEANAAAIELARAMSGAGASAVFCDPTMVSVQDFTGSPASPQGTVLQVIERARARPEAAFTMVLCGITRAPCEFWLPALLDGRRLGSLPANLHLLATVPSDGIRVPIASSVLRSLFPIEVAAPRKFGKATAKAIDRGWPSAPPGLTEESKELRLDVLERLDIADQRLTSIIDKAVSDFQFLVGGTADEIALALKPCVDWLSALDGPAESMPASVRYFRNFEG